jgi:hypothetical protein
VPPRTGCTAVGVVGGFVVVGAVGVAGVVVLGGVVAGVVVVGVVSDLAQPLTIKETKTIAVNVIRSNFFIIKIYPLLFQL